MECRKPSVKLDQTLCWKTWQRLRGSAPNFLDFPFAHMPCAQVIPSDSDSPSAYIGEKDPVCSYKTRSSAFHNSQERLHVLTRWQNLDRANYQTQMTILLRIGIWRASRVDAIKFSISVQASWSLRWLSIASFTTMAMMSGEIISTVWFFVYWLKRSDQSRLSWSL